MSPRKRKQTSAAARETEIFTMEFTREADRDGWPVVATVRISAPCASADDRARLTRVSEIALRRMLSAGTARRGNP